MQNKCLTPYIIYEATVTNNNEQVGKTYSGLCETSFKERYRTHTRSFRLQSFSKDAELSKCVWRLKNENKIPFIKWRILKNKQAKPRFSYCKSCLMESYISTIPLRTRDCEIKNPNLLVSVDAKLKYRYKVCH